MIRELNVLDVINRRVSILVLWMFHVVSSSPKRLKRCIPTLHLIATQRQLLYCRALQRPDNLSHRMRFVKIEQLLTVRVVSCLKEFYLVTPPIEQWHFTDNSMLSPSLRGSFLLLHMCQTSLDYFFAFLSKKIASSYDTLGRCVWNVFDRVICHS